MHKLTKVVVVITARFFPNLKTLLLLLSLLIPGLIQAEATTNIIFSEIRKEVEAQSAAQRGQTAGYVHLVVDKEIAEASKQALVSRYNQDTIYSANLGAYNQKVLDLHYKVFLWNQNSTKIIFYVVLFLIFISVCFSYKQFKTGSSSKTAIKYNPSEGGFEMSTSVIGFVMMFFSLLFFYLYLTEVYPVKELGSETSKQAEVSDTPASDKKIDYVKYK